jgi:hypothetical protein
MLEVLSAALKIPVRQESGEMPSAKFGLHTSKCCKSGEGEE